MKDIQILIADDQPLGQQVLEALLSREPYQLIFSSDGMETVEMATRYMPDLILLDIMMPKIDGFEVCRQLRRNPKTSHISIILITALDDRDSRLKGLESGADDFLTKPLDKNELLLRIKNLLRLSSGKSEKAILPSQFNSNEHNSEMNLVLLENIMARDEILHGKKVILPLSFTSLKANHLAYCKKINLDYYIVLVSINVSKDSKQPNAAIIGVLFNELIGKGVAISDIWVEVETLLKIEMNLLGNTFSEDVDFMIIQINETLNTLSFAGKNCLIFSGNKEKNVMLNSLNDELKSLDNEKNLSDNAYVFGLLKSSLGKIENNVDFVKSLPVLQQNEMEPYFHEKVSSGILNQQGFIVYFALNDIFEKKKKGIFKF